MLPQSVCTEPVAARTVLAVGAGIESVAVVVEIGSEARTVSAAVVAGIGPEFGTVEHTVLVGTAAAADRQLPVAGRTGLVGAGKQPGEEPPVGQQ